MVVDLIKICCGEEVFTNRRIVDPDLLELSEKEFPFGAQGGYRVISDHLIQGLQLSTETCTVTDHNRNTIQMGIVQIPLQAANYTRKDESPITGPDFWHRVIAIPSPKALETGTIVGDGAGSTWKIYPDALVFGDQRIMVSAALKWKESRRYLYLPTIANVFQIKATYDDSRFRKVYQVGTVHMCMGNVRGGLEASTFNTDLQLDPAFQAWRNLMPGFLPVFSVEGEPNALHKHQDLELSWILRNFVHEFNDRGEQVIKRLILAEFEDIKDELEAYWASSKTDTNVLGNPELLVQYKHRAGYMKAYEIYMRFLASTTTKLWRN